MKGLRDMLKLKRKPPLPTPIPGVLMWAVGLTLVGLAVVSVLASARLAFDGMCSEGQSAAYDAAACHPHPGLTTVYLLIALPLLFAVARPVLRRLPPLSRKLALITLGVLLVTCAAAWFFGLGAVHEKHFIDVRSEQYWNDHPFYVDPFWWWCVALALALLPPLVISAVARLCRVGRCAAARVLVLAATASATSWLLLVAVAHFGMY